MYKLATYKSAQVGCKLEYLSRGRIRVAVPHVLEVDDDVGRRPRASPKAALGRDRLKRHIQALPRPAAFAVVRATTTHVRHERSLHLHQPPPDRRPGDEQHAGALRIMPRYPEVGIPHSLFRLPPQHQLLTTAST